MRRAVPIVLRLAALAFAAPARAGDAFVDPLDAASSSSTLSPRRLLNAAVFAGGRVVAAGQRGHVGSSDDKGKTWTQAEVPVSSDLTALSFPSSQRGWAVGHDGVVLATTDGGRSWTRQLDGRGIEKLLQAAGGARGGAGANGPAARGAGTRAPRRDRRKPSPFLGGKSPRPASLGRLVRR